MQPAIASPLRHLLSLRLWAALLVVFVIAGAIVPGILRAQYPEATETLIVEVASAAAVDALQDYTRYPVEPIAVEPPAVVEDPNATTQELEKFAEVTVPAQDADAIKQALALDPKIVAVDEPEVLTIFRSPNDPLFPQQWGLEQPTDAADINASRAWDVSTGSRDVVIAVVDTGVDMTHPDLQGRIWTNPRETPNNGIDDDQNGFIDDVNGWNFWDNNNNPSPPSGGVGWHGTHVAGVSAATGNNAALIAGVDWNATIMPIRVFGSTGSTSTTMVARAMSYATANGASVINLSLGGSAQTSVLTAAVRDAYRQGVVVVAARGNTYDQRLQYPACDDVDGKDTVIAVAALNALGQRALFSSYGPCTNIAAPGASILSLSPGGGTLTSNGTSFAAPHTAGVATLYRAHRPGASVDEVVAAINNGDPLPLGGPGLGGGRLNAAKVLGAPAPPPNTRPTATAPTGITPDPNTPGRLTFQTTVSDADSQPTQLRALLRTPTTGNLSLPAILATASHGSVSVSDPGTYPVGARDPIDTQDGPVTLTITVNVAASFSLTYTTDAVLSVVVSDFTEEGAPAASEPFTLDTVPPRFPSYGLTVTELTETTARFSWAAASDPSFTRYELWFAPTLADAQSRSGSARRWGPAEDPALTNAQTTSTNLTGLTTGTTIYAHLWAWDSFGNFAATIIRSLTPGSSLPTPAPEQPTPPPPPPPPGRDSGGGGGGGGDGGGEEPPTGPIGGPEIPPARRAAERRGELARLRRDASRTERDRSARTPRPDRELVARAFRVTFGRSPTATEASYWSTRDYRTKPSLTTLLGRMTAEKARGRTLDPAALPAGGAPRAPRGETSLIPKVTRVFRQVHGRPPTRTEHTALLQRVLRGEVRTTAALTAAARKLRPAPSTPAAE